MPVPWGPLVRGLWQAYQAWDLVADALEAADALTRALADREPVLPPDGTVGAEAALESIHALERSIEALALAALPAQGASPAEIADPTERRRALAATVRWLDAAAQDHAGSRIVVDNLRDATVALEGTAQLARATARLLERALRTPVINVQYELLLKNWRDHELVLVPEAMRVREIAIAKERSLAAGRAARGTELSNAAANLLVLLEHERSQISVDAERVRRALDEVSKLTARRDDVDRELAGLTDVYRQRSEALAASQAELRSLRTRIASTENRIRTLGNEIAGLERELALPYEDAPPGKSCPLGFAYEQCSVPEHEPYKRAFSAWKDGLREAVQRTGARLDQARRDLAAFGEHARALTARCDALARELAAVSARVDTARRDRASLVRALDERYRRELAAPAFLRLAFADRANAADVASVTGLQAIIESGP